MTKVPTAPPPSPTTPMTQLTSHTSGSKTRQAFLSQHDDLLDEPDYESTEETLLDQDEFDLPHLHPFTLLPILQNLQKLTKFYIPNRLWGKAAEEVKKLIIDDTKKVEV